MTKTKVRSGKKQYWAIDIAGGVMSHFEGNLTLATRNIRLIQRYLRERGFKDQPLLRKISRAEYRRQERENPTSGVLIFPKEW